MSATSPNVTPPTSTLRAQCDVGFFSSPGTAAGNALSPPTSWKSQVAMFSTGVERGAKIQRAHPKLEAPEWRR